MDNIGQTVFPVLSLHQNFARNIEKLIIYRDQTILKLFQWKLNIESLKGKNGSNYISARFNNLWLYFAFLFEVFTNHISAENSYFKNHLEWSDHKIMVLKLAIKYEITWQRHNFKNILVNDFQQHSFLYQAKVW